MAAAAAAVEEAAAALAAARAERLAATQAAAALADAARLYWDTDLPVGEIAALLGLRPTQKGTGSTGWSVLAPGRRVPPLRLPASHHLLARRRRWRGELPGVWPGRFST